MKSSSSSSSSMKLLNNLRYTSLILGISNLGVIILGLILIVFGYLTSCTRPQLVPFYLLIFASAIRIFAMIRCAIAQQAAAIAIIGSSSSSPSPVSALDDDRSRRQRQLSYKRWVWWTRFETIITVVQFLLAMYLVYGLARKASQDGTSNYCGVGAIQSDEYSFLHDKYRTKESGRTSMSSEFIDDFINPFTSNEDSVEDPVSQFLERVPSLVRESSDDPSEVFLPGVIIHLIKVHRGLNLPILKGWGVQAKEPPYRAILANRDDFKDIIISPSMFLDHLPWRCQYALQKVLEYWNVERSHEGLQVV